MVSLSGNSVLQSRGSVNGAYFNIEKGKSGGFAIDKKDDFSTREERR